MLQIDNTNRVLLDGQPTGFSVIQTAEKTKVYSWSSGEPLEIDMPLVRYSLSCNKPASGVAGLSDFEKDLIKWIC